MKRHKNGSISVETAIGFSVSIVFLTAVITAVVLLRTDILMQRAVRETCSEMAVFTPLSITATDTVSTLVNALPDTVIEDQDQTQKIADLTAYTLGFDLASDGAFTSAVLDVALSRKAENTIAAKYVDYNGGSESFMPEYIDVDFDIDMNRQFIYVYVTYQVDTIVGPVYMNICDGMPFYGDKELFLNADGSAQQEDDTDDVWSLHNFDRGDRIGEAFGTNLPRTFPVIDSYEDGRATSVSSIDLTSPYYSDEEKIRRRIESEIDALADFDGADVNIDGNNYRIDGSDITSRQYTLVIPSNTPDSDDRVLNELCDYAASRGVEFSVAEYGESHAYI